MKKTVAVLLFLSLFAADHKLFAQGDTARREINSPARLRTLALAGTAVYGVTLAGLNELWYKGFPRSSFHFINDNREWQQMDKAGHVFSSYYEGVIGMELLEWAGASRKQKIWYGGMLGSFLQLSIEVFDGFSAQWGASPGDLAANTLGSALVVSQELAWDEQRLRLKFSFHQTPLAAYRPNMLGKGFSENLMKDYNGQTYWLSANIASFLKKESRFPRWLNLAVGYGSYGMLGGYSNTWTGSDGVSHNHSFIPRYRQFYLSPDIDLSRIKTRSRPLKIAFTLLNCLKFPMPSLEYNELSGFKFHYLYF